MVVMALVYAVVRLSGRARSPIAARAPWLLAGGLAALVAADLVLAQAAGAAGGARRRGAVGPAHGADAGAAGGAGGGRGAAPICAARAFGVFNLACGVALLVASALAGWLWDSVRSRGHVLRRRRVHRDGRYRPGARPRRRRAGPDLMPRAWPPRGARSDDQRRLVHRRDLLAQFEDAVLPVALVSNHGNATGNAGSSQRRAIHAE